MKVIAFICALIGFAVALLLALMACIIFSSKTEGHEMNLEKKYQALNSVVFISAGKGSGSGVVISSTKEGSVILTARHVVKKAKVGQLFVKFFPSEKKFPASIVHMSDTYDLATLFVKRKHEYIARIKVSTDMPIFYPVIKIGAGMSKRPYPAEGVVSTYDADTGFMTTSSPCIYGDSGGGIFAEIADMYFLVGIITTVGLVPTGMGGIPIPHICGSHNMYAIEEFLSEH